MSSLDRRSAGRRHAWGRGPIILKFEPLEKRELLTAIGQGIPDLVASQFVTSSTADWNDTIPASGKITNQGTGTATAPFHVDIYASHNQKIGPYSVKIGEVTIPAGLEPGQSTPFSTVVKLPPAPLPGMKPNGLLHLELKVDPDKAVPDSNRRNNFGIGTGFDESNVQIMPLVPAQLVSAAVGTYPTDAQWGGSIAVSTQIRNNSQGRAPATRVQVVLTPGGVTPGGSADVTIGSIDVPALQGWQTVNVEKNLTLPVTPPATLAGNSQFYLSVLPDADYKTNPIYPHVPISGLGTDIAQVNITVPPGTTPPALTNLPSLAATTVSVSSNTLNWGQNFQVQTTVQNLGSSDPGPFRVRFLLIGMNGNNSSGFFLGDAIIPSLQPGFDQQVIQQLQLPSRVPADVSLSSIGYARIAVVIDPENTVNETFKNNNVSTSAPITLKVLGTDGSSTVPYLPAPGQLAPKKATTTQNTNTSKNSRSSNSTRKLHRKVPPPSDNSFVHNLSVFPKRVNDFIKKYI